MIAQTNPDASHRRKGVRQPRQPSSPGFYWARQIAVDPGTRDEDEFEPMPKFEPVDVFENHYDESAPDRLRVLVPGIEKSQSLRNFEWGAPIPPPAQP
ncbi:MAG: hypothetical protein ACT6QU_02005 [Aliihoeflea sp.]|uniref:hypothetical protein n=1 Tax=Aliihoeflea sp. TaxID=2608088 RepID=UPI00403476FC